MVQFNEMPFEGAVLVDGYGPGFFRIGGEVVEGACVILGPTVTPWGGYGDLPALEALAGQVDVLLVGTGAEVAHLPPGLRAALEAAGLGIEAMATPTACRTYNVLASEGRRVAAALLPL